MEAFALYLFKSSVWLTGFALVYMLFLRNERFFSLNRIYLVFGILVSLIFPLFTWHYMVVLPVVPSIEVSDPQVHGIVSDGESFTTTNLLLLFYLSGIGYLLFRIIRQTLPVFRIIRKSETQPYRSAKLIRTDVYPASFSFFSFVFVNPSISDTETNEIVNHELEHIRQQHWIDLLLFEILRTVQWFNPAIWLYGHLIRQNHEYLADERALKRSSNPAVYRAALLNQMFGGPVISLANSFNYSLNKKRFTMMKQTISSPVRKLKLLMVLPLIAGVFYAFAAPEYKFAQTEGNTGKAEVNVPQDTKTIKGKVADENGKPLKSATIIISGKTIGTITDNDGNFMLKVTDDSPIVISYVGFETMKMKPDFGKEMTISMKTKAVQINLDEKALSSKSETMKVQTNAPLKFGDSDNTESKPLIIIDGVVAQNQNTDNIPPENIESISVLKDESATRLYGEKGKNGVILITMKKGETAMKNEQVEVKVTGYANDQKANQSNSGVQIRSTGTSITGPKPLVVIDGVIAENQNLDKIDPETIESMAVLKDESATSKYGDKGKNGVVEIKMKPKTGVFTIVEEMPKFSGGVDALQTFVYSSMKYPEIALENGIEGQVYINFVVAKDGSVINAKVSRGVAPSLDKEAKRIVESMPKWNPGKQNGEAVDVAFTMQINFKLPPEKVSKEKLK